MTVPILRDVPESFESERLIIRAPRPGDGAERCAAVTESLQGLRPRMPWAKEPPTADEGTFPDRTRGLDGTMVTDLCFRLLRSEAEGVLPIDLKPAGLPSPHPSRG
jgi:hypothetical protein